MMYVRARKSVLPPPPEKKAKQQQQQKIKLNFLVIIKTLSSVTVEWYINLPFFVQGLAYFH